MIGKISGCISLFLFLSLTIQAQFDENYEVGDNCLNLTSNFRVSCGIAADKEITIVEGSPNIANIRQALLTGEQAPERFIILKEGESFDITISAPDNSGCTSSQPLSGGKIYFGDSDNAVSLSIGSEGFLGVRSFGNGGGFFSPIIAGNTTDCNFSNYSYCIPVEPVFKREQNYADVLFIETNWDDWSKYTICLPVLVEGNNHVVTNGRNGVPTQGSVLAPQIPWMILRDPPGDESF
ncbi:MAG: hypothetical protein AB8G22_16360, partial [Saprospiraceae bacterium]